MLTALGLLAATLIIVYTWPQTLRVLRTGDVTGIALPALVASMACTVCWLGFGLLTADAAQIFCNSASLLGSAALLSVVHRRRPFTGRGVLVAAGAVVVAAAVGALAGGAGGLATAGALIGTSAQLPQLRNAWAGRVAGLSVASFGLLTVAEIAWCVYGACQGTPQVWGSAVATMGIAAAIVVLTRRHRRAATGPVEELELALT